MPSRSPMLVRYAWAGITILVAAVLSVVLAPLTDRSAVAFFVAAVAITASVCQSLTVAVQPVLPAAPLPVEPIVGALLARLCPY